MEARSGQNYLTNFLLCIFNFMSFVFNSMVERINFIFLFNFLIVPFRAISANLGNSITVLVLFCILFDR